MKTFDEVYAAVRERPPVTFAVAAAADRTILEALDTAQKNGLGRFILTGDAAAIRRELSALSIPEDTFRIERVDGDLPAVAARAVALVAAGEAEALMKGQVDTSILLKALLNEKSLRTERSMSVTGIAQTSFYKKLLYIADAGFIIQPTRDQKADIVRNAAELVRATGIESPKVAAVCAKEKVSPKMPDTEDAAALAEMSRAGELGSCVVEGPFGLDNAVDIGAARQKGVENEVAGDADILLMPDLVSANVLYKALGFLSDARLAGYLSGAKVPVVITSRADTMDTKLNSLAMTALAVGAARD